MFSNKCAIFIYPLYLRIYQNKLRQQVIKYFTQVFIMLLAFQSLKLPLYVILEYNPVQFH